MVESKTIGTEIAYRLTTENLSRSGMLLSWNRSTSVPFIVNTIVELRIDPGTSHLAAPVSCLGKVVRRDDASGTKLGIQIIQINNDDLVAWESCVATIEKKTRQLQEEAMASQVAVGETH